MRQRRRLAGVFASLAALSSCQGCTALTAVGASLAGAKSVYDIAGTAATDTDKIVAVACRHYFNKRLKMASGQALEIAQWGDAYCASPPSGSDPVESAIWLGELVGKMNP